MRDAADARAEAERERAAAAERERAAAEERQRAAAAAASQKPAPSVDSAPAPSSFVPCQFCGRTFFPDRLAPHLRVCKKKQELRPNGCRPTMTDGATVTVGQYEKNF